MKLNINAKELLALHNLLYDRYAVLDGDFKADDPRAADDLQLRQVYNRLRACVIAALNNRQFDPIDAFLSKEQAKIDRLKDQEDALKKEQLGLASALGIQPAMLEDDDDYVVADYPRRIPRNRSGNRGGNKR